MVSALRDFCPLASCVRWGYGMGMNDPMPPEAAADIRSHLAHLEAANGCLQERLSALEADNSLKTSQIAGLVASVVDLQAMVVDFRNEVQREREYRQRGGVAR